MSNIKKSQVFTSRGNIKKLTNLALAQYDNINSSEVQMLIEQKIPGWPQFQHIDKYESLNMDPIAEMDYLNKKFIDYLQNFLSTRAENPLAIHDNTNWGVEQWRNMDTGKRKQNQFQQPGERTIANENFRFGNAIPYYQKHQPRHYDRDLDGTGYQGHALEGHHRGIYDMDHVMKLSKLPFRKPQDLDFDYYENDDSNLQLTSTRWRTN